LREIYAGGRVVQGCDADAVRNHQFNPAIIPPPTLKSPDNGATSLNRELSTRTRKRFLPPKVDRRRQLVAKRAKPPPVLALMHAVR